EDRIGEAFETIEISETGIDLDKDWLRPPSSTWTYVINDQTMSEIQRLLYGFGNLAFAAGAVVTTWPLLIAWQCLRWFKKREK
ncbi:MAG: accessory Sec system translocase SecA2, partial [Blastocatellia bacterium]|nr:accessory Sec system translocase SecA2 [Blastocatellia bacterium]